MNRVTQTADELIHGERARLYGPPHTNFAVIANLWDAYMWPSIEDLLKKEGQEVSFRPRMIDENDVCNMMTLLKLAREATGQGYHEDSTVDAIGYQAIKQVLQTPIDTFLREMNENGQQDEGAAAVRGPGRQQGGGIEGIKRDFAD